MKTNPIVSVIVPIYNNDRYLDNCIKSIIGQTYQNLEIILIDDGSTDNSDKIINNYAKKDSRIKTIHQKNAGQSAARNRGLKIATGDYISFVDGDDKIKPNFIEKLLQPYLDNPTATAVSVCGIHYKRLKQNSSSNVYINPIRKRRKSESQKAYILYLLAIDGRMYSSVNKLYQAKIVKRLTFDEKLNFAEDTKFVLDYLNKAVGKIQFILDTLYTYNFGTETSTIKTTALNWQNWQTSYKNLKHWLGPHPSLTEKFWLHLVHLRWRISFVRSVHRAKH